MNHSRWNPELSVVVPVFNEAANVEALHARVTDSLAGSGLSYELMFVDDGSLGRDAPVAGPARGGRPSGDGGPVEPELRPSGGGLGGAWLARGGGRSW